MKTEDIVLWGGVAFAGYYFFLRPKPPVPLNPVLTNQGLQTAPTSLNTGATVTTGILSLVPVLQKIFSTPTSPVIKPVVTAPVNTFPGEDNVLNQIFPLQPTAPAYTSPFYTPPFYTPPAQTYSPPPAYGTTPTNDSWMYSQTKNADNNVGLSNDVFGGSDDYSAIDDIFS